MSPDNSDDRAVSTRRTVVPSSLLRTLDRGWTSVTTTLSATLRRLKESQPGRWWVDTERPGRADWALLVMILLVAYVTFLYGDVRATFEHSFHFLDALFSGRVGDFYEIAIEHTSTGHPAVYDVPLYLIFGLWNLPTYVIYRITGFDYLHSTPAELWLKTMIVMSAVLAARVLISLARDLGVGRRRSTWVGFFFLSSMSVFVPVFVIVQYDIVLVLVMLLGVRSYVRGDTRGFLLWFMVANTLKLFAVFVFIPLVLLREKRLRHAAWHLAVGVIGLFLCRLMYHGNVAYKASTSGFMDGMLKRLVATGVQWQNAEFSTTVHVIPFFVVFMVGVALFAYCWRAPSDDRLNRMALYVCLAVYLAFVTLVPLNPYWIVLVAPFAVLTIFLNPRFLLLNTLLETGIATSLFLLYIMVGFPIYNLGIFSELLLPHLVDGAADARFSSPDEVLGAFGLSRGASFLIGFVIACSIAVLVLNYPRDRWPQGEANEERMPRSVVWTRLAMPTAFSGLLFLTYFLPAPPVAYSALTDTAEASQVNLLEPGATISETLVFENTIDVSAINIGFLAGQVQWIDSSEVSVDVTDSSGTSVYSAQVPANSLGDAVHAFDTPDLVLQGDEPYTVTITSSLTEGGVAYVQVNTAVDQFVTTENGAGVAGDLVLSISGTQR